MLTDQQRASINALSDDELECVAGVIAVADIAAAVLFSM